MKGDRRKTVGATNHTGEELLTYVRLLDAEVDGASHDEMAAVLYPELPNDPPDYQGRAKVQESLAEAKGLRDGGYMELLL